MKSVAANPNPNPTQLSLLLNDEESEERKAYVESCIVTQNATTDRFHQHSNQTKVVHKMKFGGAIVEAFILF